MKDEIKKEKNKDEALEKEVRVEVDKNKDGKKKNINKEEADKIQQIQESSEHSVIAEETLKENQDEEKQQEESKPKTVVVKGKKKKKREPFLRGGRGQIHIKSSYNNTIVTVADLNGAVLAWSTAGKCGFKGPKKATPYAAGVIVRSLVEKIKQLGIKEVDVYVKGVGTGREAAVRALGTNNIQIVSIKDMTPIPHGGCRPRKPRRV